MHLPTKIKTIPKLAWLNALSFALVIVVLIGYIAEVNQTATAGYEMKALEESIADLAVLNEQLEYRIAKHQSVDTVTNKLKMLGLVPVDQVAYTSAAAATVAINR